jgi:hypothetical protein
MFRAGLVGRMERPEARFGASPRVSPITILLVKGSAMAHFDLTRPEAWFPIPDAQGYEISSHWRIRRPRMVRTAGEMGDRAGGAESIIPS